MVRRRTYTIHQAAKKLGISRAAVYKAIKTQRLRAKSRVLKLQKWVISPAALASYQVSASHQERGKNCC